MNALDTWIVRDARRRDLAEWDEQMELAAQWAAEQMAANENWMAEAMAQAADYADLKATEENARY